MWIFKFATSLVDALENHVQVINQHYRAQPEVSTGLQQAFKTCIRQGIGMSFALFSLLHGRHQTVGGLALVYAVKFIRKRFTGDPPEICEIFNLVKLFGKRQCDEVALQACIPPDSNGQPLE